LIEAAASLKSFRRKDKPPSDRPSPDDPGNPTVNFRGEKRSNATHRSTTDPEARLAKKGRGFESKLACMGHALMENRHGLLVDFQLTQATGTAERDLVPQLLYDAELRGLHPLTLGADKAYDAARVSPPSASTASRITWRRIRTEGAAQLMVVRRGIGYEKSQRIRKRIEDSLPRRTNRYARQAGPTRRDQLGGLKRASR
jgi:hypothetical protein